MNLLNLRWHKSTNVTLKFFALSALFSFSFSCAKRQDRTQSLVSQISQSGGVYTKLEPKFSDSVVNRNGSSDKPISIVKIQIKGANNVCLAYVGDLYRLESVAYQHLPSSKKNFDLRSCDDPSEALVLWYQVRITAEGELPAKYAYVKIVKAPDRDAPRNAVDFVFMGLLYHSADALTHNWSGSVEEHKEETFLGFLKRLRRNEIIVNESIQQELFTSKFLDLIVQQVFIPKTTQEKFHHFQGPFSLTPATNSGDEGWNMLTSTFQTLPGINGVYANRMNYCLVSTADQGFVVTKKENLHDNSSKPCARMKIIAADSDKQYYYEISPENAL